MAETVLKTILLVEDETDLRVLYAEVLRDAGFNVLEAVDGKEAIDKASLENWDLMLLDIILPKLDGIKVLKLLEENKIVASRPIVIVTTLENEGMISEGFEHGASGYLIKSEITPQDLVEEVKSYLK